MVEPTFVLLLFNLGVAASLASILSRIPAFQRMLLREQRTMTQRLEMALAFGTIFGASAAARVLTGTYQAADLTLAGAYLAGLLGGYVTGLVSGILMSLPAMFAQELLAMPLYAGIGVIGGLVRDFAPNPEEIWRYSPLFDILGFWRVLRNRALAPAWRYRILITLGVLVAESLRLTGQLLFKSKIVHNKIIFSPVSLNDTPLSLWIGALCGTSIFCTLLPIKIWNTTRMESMLSRQQRLIAEARLAALTSQINPHFLFNTLNSVSSLIRIDQDRARAMIYKLSNVLRRAMKNTDNFAPLRDELAFIDDYFSIELVRFGEKLRFVRDVAANTLDVLVPSMVLQPLIENSIKHGLAGKLDGGTIWLRASIVDENRLLLVVEDDGEGIPEEKMADLFGTGSGIGVSNVKARLEVLFSNSYRMSVDSRLGHGTRTEIEIPASKTAITGIH
ncbi:sensor histidine kinase [Bryobacter aggregatus]|uniref:sensor histidine kinase n=1 Tax=Bryobacter aggregatus TaxID=360054 RepID=UPI0004E0DF13|nr:histidine kinase [Bryobacter aggregatus]